MKPFLKVLPFKIEILYIRSKVSPYHNNVEPVEDFKHGTIQVVQKVTLVSLSYYKNQNIENNNVKFDKIGNIPKHNLRALSDF